MASFDIIIKKKFEELLDCGLYPLSTVDKISITLAFKISSEVDRNDGTSEWKPFILYNSRSDPLPYCLLLINPYEISARPVGIAVSGNSGMDMGTQVP